MLPCAVSDRSGLPCIPKGGWLIHGMSPRKESKLYPKPVIAHQILKQLGGHKSELLGPCLRSSEIVRGYRLKISYAETEGEPTSMETSETEAMPRLAFTSSFPYTLRPGE